MAKVLRDDALPADTGLAIELHIPQSSKRIGFTFTGHDDLGGKSAVLVELKQWSTAKATTKDAIGVTTLGKEFRETVHPPTRIGPTLPFCKASTRRCTTRALPLSQHAQCRD